MVLVVVLVASTSSQAAVVLQDDFSGDSLDTSKWLKLLYDEATITQEDGVAHILRGGTNSADRAYLVTVEQWIPAVGAELTVSGTVFLPLAQPFFDVWLRAADEFDTSLPDPPWQGRADSGLRFSVHAKNHLIEGQVKYPGVSPWVNGSLGTTVDTLTRADDKYWNFVVTDDGTNVTMTVTELDEYGDPTTNTATFYGTSDLAVTDEYHVLFNGNDIKLDEVTIVVGEVVRIPGDANNNGVVNAEDASILAAHWQMAGNWGDGDFNNDQIVDDKDAAILAAHWLMTGEEYASVPEPAMLVLLAGGLVTLLLWRRK
jgi:hypothetical protein